MLGIGLSRATGGLLTIGMVSGFILTLTSSLGIGRFVASYMCHFRICRHRRDSVIGMDSMHGERE